MEKRAVLLLPTIIAQTRPGFVKNPAAITRHVEILLVIGDKVIGRGSVGR
jgi:hypothetical protein